MLKLEGTYYIPEWALCYFANGEIGDDWTEEDVKMVERFVDSLPDNHVWDFDVTDEEKYGNWFINELDSRPEFGLPCKTYEIPLWVETNEHMTEFDIVIMDNDIFPEKIEILRNRKFADVWSAEYFAKIYYRHWGHGLTYHVFPSDKNAINIID